MKITHVNFTFLMDESVCKQIFGRPINAKRKISFSLFTNRFKMSKKVKKRENYTTSDLLAAMSAVNSGEITAYRAAKHFADEAGKGGGEENSRPKAKVRSS